MNKYDEMVVRITTFCREPLNFGLFGNFGTLHLNSLSYQLTLVKKQKL